MPSSIDFHLAGEEEIAQAHANVFDFWTKAETIDEHVSFLLKSYPFRRANWFVGCVDNRVVTSLGAYPIEFQIAGEIVPAMAIGSVFTTADSRKQGFARQLIDSAEQWHRERQVFWSILYSDVKPEYYGRMGYVICPSHEGWCNPLQSDAAAADDDARLVPFDPQQERTAMEELYAGYHHQKPICFARNDEYWSGLLKKYPHDEFYWLSTGSDDRAGFARVTEKNSKYRLTDYALADPQPAAAESLYKALVGWGRSRGIERLGGWLPDSSAARKFFQVEPRPIEITMIKPLDPQNELTPKMIAAADYFCEIDHV